MRIFEHPNVASSWKCPICKQDTDKQVMLLSKYFTQNHNIVVAAQVHVDCLDLWFYPDQNFIGMRWEEK